MNDTIDTLDTLDTRIDASIVDGRVAMDVENLEGRVTVTAPVPRPLSEGETHLELQIGADGVSVGIELDAAGVDALADAIHRAREGDR